MKFFRKNQPIKVSEDPLIHILATDGKQNHVVNVLSPISVVVDDMYRGSFRIIQEDGKPGWLKVQYLRTDGVWSEDRYISLSRIADLARDEGLK